MSSLWMEMPNASDHFFHKMPSPMCNSLLSNSFALPYIEKIYLLISCRICKGRINSEGLKVQFPNADRCNMAGPAGDMHTKGSMTVEAALLMPLLILFVLHLGSCMEMLRLHGRLEYALWQTGRELAVYEAAEAGGSIPELAISYLYVNGRLQQILGRDYLDSSPLAHGHQEMNYLASEYMEEDECINIVLTYQVCPQITCFPFPYFRMASRYYGRAWTGYAVEDRAEQTSYVYVTENGEVWHSRADCSYLRPNVYEARTETVQMLRNEEGERYRPCSRCGDWPLDDAVYQTREGNCYHRSRSCPALLRRIHAVVWQESIPYRPCSRCATAP